ncbi:MAG: hypothetical protein IKF71_04650 [Bacilli bacterium]|nr:hypothetical protein [Bacilli bacterium]
MKKKKLLGAIIPAVLLIIYLIFILVFFTYTSFMEGDVPIPAFIIITIGIAFPIVGILIALILRIKEIKKGELEEAKKY